MNMWPYGVRASLFLHNVRLLNHLWFIACLSLNSCISNNGTGTEDVKAKWIELNSGLGDLHIQSLSLDPDQSNILYLSAFDGIHKTIDGGANWVIANQGMSSSDVTVMTSNPRNNHIIIAGTWGDGLYMTEDSGASWHAVNNGIFDLRIRAIAVDINDVNHIIVASSTELYESSSLGKTWRSLGAPTDHIIALAVDFRRMLLFVGTGFSGIFKSNSKSISWQVTNRSNFQRLGEDIYLSVSALEWVQDSTQMLWAAVSGKGVFFSNDDGENWQLFADEIPTVSIEAMAVFRIPNRDAGSNQRAVAVGTRGGVFLGREGEKLWMKLDEGLLQRDTRALAVYSSSAPVTIFVGTYGSGVFKYELR